MNISILDELKRELKKREKEKQKKKGKDSDDEGGPNARPAFPPPPKPYIAASGELNFDKFQNTDKFDSTC